MEKKKKHKWRKRGENGSLVKDNEQIVISRQQYNRELKVAVLHENLIL